MRKVKKTISVLLSIIMVFGLFAIVPINAEATSATVENAIAWAIDIANDDSHGYSQSTRWGPDYDCSSFVISAFRSAGVDTGSASYTGDMRSQFTQHGFIWIPWSQIGGVENLQRGDILLNEVHHTEIYIGNNKNVGAHSNRGYPQLGDQTGTEVSVDWYYYKESMPWNGVLRYIDDPPTIDYGQAVDVGTNFYATILNNPYWINIASDSNNNVVLKREPANITANFVWRFDRNNDSSYTITNMASGKVLDVANASTNSGANVIVSENHYGENQKWFVYSKNGSYCIKAKNTECVLDLTGNSNIEETNIQMHTLNDTDAQKFAISKLPFDFNVQYLDINKDFYAFILNKPLWKTISVDNNNNVELRSEISPACANQVWKFEKQWDATYKIISTSNSYCLDVENNSNTTGSNVIVSKDNNSDSQRWYIFRTSEGLKIRPKNSYCVLDLKGFNSDNGTNIQIHTDNGSGAQQFDVYMFDFGSMATNFGDDFTGPLLKAVPWITVTEENNTLKLSSEQSTSSFLWRFIRQKDGSYKIYSTKNGKCIGVSSNDEKVCLLDDDDSNAVRWYIYIKEGYHVFQSKYKGKYLCTNGDENGEELKLCGYDDISKQLFAIYFGEECVPKAPTLEYGLSLNKLNLSWNDVYGETYYRVSVYKLDDTTNSYNLINTSDTEECIFSMAFDKGEYKAVVSLENYYYSLKSNEVEFTINNLIGDINLDGQINVTDVTELQKHISKIITLNSEQVSVADCDNDGIITVRDATMIQKMIVNLI